MRPPETAPKNRTVILAHIHLYGEMMPAVWNEEEDSWVIAWAEKCEFKNRLFPHRFLRGWMPMPVAPENPFPETIGDTP